MASYNDRDYFYDVASSRTGVLYGVPSYDFSLATTLTGGVSYEELRSTPFFHGLPHYVNGDDIGLKRSTSLAQDWNRWNGKQTTVFAELAHRFNQDWSTKLTATSTQESNDSKYAFTEGAVNPATGLGPTMYAGIFDFSTHNKALNLDVDGARGAGPQALGHRRQLTS